MTRTEQTAPGNPELPDNRGRWGRDDQRGTLNHITEAARARGVTQARIGRTVSLAAPVYPVPLAGGGPTALGMSPMPAPVTQLLLHSGPAPALTDVLVINTHHVGLTHLDALAHISVEGTVYPGVPVHEAISGATLRHGSTSAFVGGITTRGVLLDLAPGDRLPAGHSVTSADLGAAEERAGLRVESGDALVVRGGWAARDDITAPLPSFGLDTLRWLADREIAVIASDIGDRLPGPGAPAQEPALPLHEVGLARLGLPLIDGAEVEELAEVCREIGRWEFLFVAAPMPIHGCTGVPVNPMAIF